jgi:hypothetical protein
LFSDEKLVPSRDDSFSRSSCISRFFFSRNSIGVILQPFGESSIGCKLTPQTAQLLGIRLFFGSPRRDFPQGGELSNRQIRTSRSAHLQLLGLDFPQDHLQPSRPRLNSSFGAVHPDTDRSYAEARKHQPPQFIIVGACPWSRGEVRGF